MKKLAFLGGAVAVGVFAISHAPISYAADHLDAPTIGMAANRMADLNDVYAWMTSDGTKVNLALTVSPADNASPQHFGATVVYAFHVSSRAAFGMAGMESKIICKFAGDTDGECWVVDPAGKTIDYVKGDLSVTTGRASASGKFRVFAGKRSDPFFFNLAGFKRAVGAAEAACGGGTAAACPGVVPADTAGCLQINKATGDALRGLVTTASTIAVAPCAANQIDCFIGFNVAAIVVQVDKTELLVGTDKIVSVWASTHAGN